MIQQTPWLERRFNFDFPVGFFPKFFERFIGTPARARLLVTAIAEERLVNKPSGKWSVKEQIGHLIDLEALHKKRFFEYLEGKTMLSAADMNNQATESANHNAMPVEKLLERLEAVRSHFALQMYDLTAEQLGRKAIHPRLRQSMRLVDLVYFICEHDDHHLASARQLLNLRSS
jgi:uncharacterized damage-inducible protein DinB